MSCHRPISYRNSSEKPMRAIWPVRASSPGSSAKRELEQVVVEDLLSIEIQEVDSYTLLCTPHDTLALAAGFAFSEGMVESRDDLLLLSHCPDNPGVVRMQLADPARAKRSGRNLILTSSCGACGSRNTLEELRNSFPAVGNHLSLPGSFLQAGVESMREQQRIFSQTGGTHAAAIFSASGDLLAFGEDIGRHNALDKAIGKLLMKNQTAAGCAVCLSGRVSFELVAKSARAGLELIAAVSAPSTLAIDTAEWFNLTLCAFVREDRFTVYTHPRRIRDLKE